MSMELMVKAMKTKVGNPLRKLVLLKLADNANDQGECWPSYQYIADQCEISRSTVKNHIRELEKSGFLTREFRKKGTVNQSNVFHLVLDQENVGVGQQMPGVGQQLTGVGQQMTGGGAADARGGGAAAAPRTSHSFESVNEPLDLLSDSDESNEPEVVDDSDRFDAKAKTELLTEAFELFWQSYQKKSGRKAALKAFLKIRLPNDRPTACDYLQNIIDRAQRWGILYASGPDDQKQFQPLPSTWINNERWNDEELPTIRRDSESGRDWATEMVNEEERF